MNIEGIKNIIAAAAASGKKNLTEPAVKEILRLGGVEVPRFEVIAGFDEAADAAKKVGFPLVLKVVSPDISHKSEAHGVALGIKDLSGLEEELSYMTLNVADHSPSAAIEGFLLEQTAPAGVEVIVGALKDPQFGTMVMFGTGGIGAELMKDVSWRLGPVTKDEALDMMSEVKGYPLLTGFRGDSPKDVFAAAQAIVALSLIMDGAPGLKGIEINPLIVSGQGAVAADAKAELI